MRTITLNLLPYRRIDCGLCYYEVAGVSTEECPCELCVDGIFRLLFDTSAPDPLPSSLTFQASLKNPKRKGFIKIWMGIRQWSSSLPAFFEKNSFPRWCEQLSMYQGAIALAESLGCKRPSFNEVAYFPLWVKMI